MMRIEGISTGSGQNELAVGRQGKAGKNDEAFSTLLDLSSPMAASASTVHETLLSPVGAPDGAGCSGPGVGVVDPGKAAVVYQHNAARYGPGEGVPVASKGDIAVHSLKDCPSALEVEKAPTQRPTEGALPHASSGGLSQVMSEIKGFFVRFFSPQGPSAGASQPAAREKASEAGSNNPVAGFFGRLRTMLSFGLWRPEERQESGRGLQDAVTKASAAGVDSLEPDHPASISSRQELGAGAGEATGSAVVKTIRNLALEVPAKIREAIEEAAHKYDLPADLIAAVIKVESNFDTAAVSKEGGGGLMQLMPATARALAVRNRFDLGQNIDGGSRYLKSLLERFDGQVELALAAYNAGPDAVERYGGVPPYRQTHQYVKKVLAHC